MSLTRIRSSGPAAPAFYRELACASALLVLGGDGRIRYATPPASELLGRPDVTGARLEDLAGEPGLTAPGLAAETWVIPAAGGRAVHVEVTRRDPQGTDVGGVILALRDVTAQRQAEQEMLRLALHDPLTGLPNRLLLTDRADHAIAMARRTDRPAALMLADLDGFKSVNDTLGHAAGDDLLAAVAAQLAAACRESDTIARYGGDEFAVVAEGISGPAEAGRLAGRLVRACAAPFTVAARQVSIGISVGVATTAGHDDMAVLIARADTAMYEAKAAGGQRWRLYRGARQGEARQGEARQGEARPGWQLPSRLELAVSYWPAAGTAADGAPGPAALACPR